MFEVFIFLCLRLWSQTGVFGVEVKLVMEGDSVTLNPDVTDVQRAEEIKWKFNDILIAVIYRQDNTGRIHNDGADGRFRDRLKLDHQTGSLIITDTTINHSGLYNVYSGRTLFHTFNLTVYAHLPVPVITIYCPLSSSSESRLVLVCSVVNVSHVTLSWLKGNSLLSSISVSDLNRSISLHLECLNDSYSCVVNNPISNQTARLDIRKLIYSEVCVCCGFTEAVIRLVLSALVGVAAVAVLVYEISSHNLQLKRREQTSPSN